MARLRQCSPGTMWMVTVFWTRRNNGACRPTSLNRRYRQLGFDEWLSMNDHYYETTVIIIIEQLLYLSKKHSSFQKSCRYDKECKMCLSQVCRLRVVNGFSFSVTYNVSFVWFVLHVNAKTRCSGPVDPSRCSILSGLIKYCRKGNLYLWNLKT